MRARPPTSFEVVHCERDPMLSQSAGIRAKRKSRSLPVVLANRVRPPVERLAPDERRGAPSCLRRPAETAVAIMWEFRHRRRGEESLWRRRARRAGVRLLGGRSTDGSPSGSSRSRSPSAAVGRRSPSIRPRPGCRTLAVSRTRSPARACRLRARRLCGCAAPGHTGPRLGAVAGRVSAASVTSSMPNRRPRVANSP